MTLIKWNNGRSKGNSAYQKSLPTVFDSRSLFDAFNYPFESVRLLQNLLDDDLGITGSNIGKSLPAVNISENADSLMIEVAAPGMNKKDFGIEFHDNILRISYTKEKNNEDKTEKNVLRREFSYESFERTFTMPETISGENISASYEDGLLKIVAPKKEEAKVKPAKNIEIK